MYLSLIKNINSINKKYIFISIFLLAVIVLSFPSGIYTGLTGKDEYYLSFRVVLEMLESQQWFIPFLDEAPRLRKPPLLYWLGYFWSELIGFSLYKLRLLSCILTSIFIITLLEIANEIFLLFSKNKIGLRNTNLILLAALLLSNFVIITEGRRFMLDIPVNVFSALSLLCFLKAKIFATEKFPRDFSKYFWISVGFILLSFGFLIKGPIVFIFCGSGIISLCLANFIYFNNLKNFVSNYKNVILLLLIIGISFLLMFAWFWIAKNQFTAEFAAVLEEELSARNFFEINLKPFISIILIAFPFSIFGIYLIYLKAKKYIKNRRKILNSKTKFLFIWLLLNLLPYCFIKSFERYLVAAIFPLILLVAIYFPILIKSKICRRLSSIILVLIYALFCVFIYYFQLNSAFSFIENFIIAATLFLFIYYWNFRQNKFDYVKKFASLLLLWNVILCILFPALNINFIPSNIINIVQNKNVIYYKGPQPAMLSIITKKANLHYNLFKNKDIKNIQKNIKNKTIIFVENENLKAFFHNINRINRLQKNNKNNQIKIHYLGNYQTLTTKGSGIKFIDFNNDKTAIMESIKSRNIRKLQKTIFYFEISNN